mmetsp:Transcript_27788/g.66027  ORF Transcript_27788/g.66027 Transcript_27788/m.66027 type:complete len:671 (-) Transcript_27788:342-2354(-)
MHISICYWGRTCLASVSFPLKFLNPYCCSLRQRETVDQLITYLVELPGDSDDPKRQFKYPYAACEIFACEVEEMFTVLLEDDKLMGRLFGFLESEQPLNTSLAGYFGRVVGSLLVRRTGELMGYLKQHQEVLENLVGQLQTTSIAEVVVQLVGSDEQSFMYYGNHHMYWLAETNLMDLLIERLGPGFPPEVQANAADILAAIAHTQPSPLATKLSTWRYMEMLFARALEPGRGDVLVPTLNVCIALLEPKRVSTENDFMSPDVSAIGALHSSQPAGDSSLKAEAAKGILKEMPRLVELLKQPPSGKTTMSTTFGELSPPLGTHRWKVAELLSVLAASHSSGVEAALISNGAVRTCLGLFLEFPFNNLLHHVVTCLLQACLDGSSEMVSHLLKDCALPTWLASCPSEVVVSTGGAPLRAGYMGHITQLGNSLADLGSRSPEVKKLLDVDKQWALFVNTTLNERNSMEDVHKWSCGRPAALGSPGDDDLQDSDFRFQTHDVFHRYPDDDENDEDEEMETHNFFGADDVNHEMSSLAVEDTLQLNKWDDANSGGSGTSSDSDDGGNEAVVPTPDGPVPVSQTDDDAVVVANSDDDDLLAGDIVFGGSPTCAPVEPMDGPVGDALDGAAGSPDWRNSPVSPKGQASVSVDEAEPQFNSFQYWRTSIPMEVPEDL